MNSPDPVTRGPAGHRWWQRYETMRAAQHDRFLRRWANRFPRLRNRRTARRLVVALTITMLLVLAAAIGTFFANEAIIAFAALTIGVMLPIIWILRAITLNVNDAPASSLDEFQLAGRNAARSIAYTALWVLMFIPYILLMAVSQGGDSSVSGEVIYGSALLLIVLVAGVSCIPLGLAAWWLQDPDPEDYEPYPHSGTSDLAESATETGGHDA
ncbi:UNVERIFIED_CONTAM: hypothetical protein DES50_11260 [Williamsia faeni]